MNAESSIPIRLARAEDVPAILAIANAAARTTTANFALGPESLAMWMDAFDAHAASFPWLVTTDDTGALCGFAKASPWKGRCAYAYSAETTIYLDPAVQGQGCGRRLYARLLEILDAQGYRTLIGGIALPNAASVALHEKLGYVHIGTFHSIGWKFGAWHDVGYWERVRGEGPPKAVRAVAEVM